MIIPREIKCAFIGKDILKPHHKAASWFHDYVFLYKRESIGLLR